MRKIHRVAVYVGFVFACTALGQTQIPVKQVAAPPNEIVTGLVKLPDPVELGVTSNTALFEIDPQRADENRKVSFGIPLMLGEGRGRVIFLPAEDDAWVGIVTSTNLEGQQDTKVRTDEQRELAGVSRVKHPLPWNNSGREFDAIVLPGDQDAMQIEIELKKNVGGYILVDQLPDRSLYTYVKQRRTLVDSPITLANSLSDGSKIVTLGAVVRSPDGVSETIEAELDSAEFSFTPTQPGKYSVHVYAEYANDQNWSIVLTTQHLIEVEESAPSLRAATVEILDNQIMIGFDAGEPDRRVIVAAEVWGRADGKLIPVCWLSRICDDQRSLSLDPRWISLAGADPESLELQQIRVHDVDSLVPLEVVRRMDLELPAIELPAAPSSITQDMLQGRFSQPVLISSKLEDSAQRGTLAGGHRLLLLHGYCSDGNPFTTSHFNGDVAVFHDPFMSRSHDAFALEILAQTAPMKSFGVAAHSQGGMASLHLYTYYFSGMDWARGERLIQSVGTPYQGTALAGNAAVLGDIFGFGCGENPDMTYTGAANWLSLIPTSSRQMVWYYTTSFEDRPFLFDYCNIITDLLLSDPDDGVIERSAGQLPGASNEGHIEGWCHTAGMRDPAQCTDTNRNQQINTRARR